MRRVIRPGWLQYAYMFLLPAMPIALGIATFAYGFSVEFTDWTSRIPWAVGVALLGIIPVAYMLGMWIEVTDTDVSKVRLYGRWRTTIPIDHLSMSVERSGNDTVKVVFANEGGPGSFGLYKTWVWREKDVDDLAGLVMRPRRHD
jgi:hypothetical protein